MLRKISAVALFIATIATISVMWLPAFWATAIAELSAFCLAAAWLIGFLMGKQRLQIRTVLISLVAAAGWAAFQWVSGATIYRWATGQTMLYWAAGASIVFVGLAVFDDRQVRIAYLRALVVAGFIIAIVAPLQLFTAESKIYWLFDSPDGWRAMGPFPYANQYAAFIELLFPIALTGVFVEKSGWKTFYGLAAAVMYASVFASTSRSGLIFTTIEVFVVPMLAARRSGISFRQVAVPGLIFLGMLITMGLAVGPERMIEKFHQKNPYYGRLKFSEASLRMIADHPWIGIGAGNWARAYPAYATFDNGSYANQAHNDWAEWTVEGGIPFLLIMVSAAAWSVRRAFKTGWGLGVAVVFCQCLMDFPIQRIGVAMVFFTVIAAIGYDDDSPRQRRQPVPE